AKCSQASAKTSSVACDPPVPAPPFDWQEVGPEPHAGTESPQASSSIGSAPASARDREIRTSVFMDPSSCGVRSVQRNLEPCRQERLTQRSGRGARRSDVHLVFVWHQRDAVEQARGELEREQDTKAPRAILVDGQLQGCRQRPFDRQLDRERELAGQGSVFRAAAYAPAKGEGVQVHRYP